VQETRTKESKPTPVTPRLASTVILLREQQPTGFEAFLLRRHGKSIFMAGNYVYPGGTVDKGDDNEAVLSHCITGPSGGTSDAGHPFADLLGYRVAAIRELFEEAGVLLAYRVDRTPFQLSDDAEQRRFSDYRKKLNAGQLSMRELAAGEHILLALDQLHYYTHWITPEANPVRFDTRFFVARHPSGQVASPDLKETTDGIWTAPKPALEANIQGTVPLSPPTLKTLEDVARFDTLDSFLSSLKGKERKPPVLPVSVTIAGETVLIFPWDPEYEAYKTGVVGQITLGASHGRPSTPSDNTTRLVYRGGLWLPFVKAA
jgi:8-oxo-dGTP pyrophosphatase MutT (NUDIX family)